jgi:endonuclease-3
MKQPQITWSEAIKPLIRKYKNEEHPLKAQNLYQCLVMVVLSAQTTDNIINGLAPELFAAFRNIHDLSAATEESVIPYITKIRNFSKKAK